MMAFFFFFFFTPVGKIQQRFDTHKVCNWEDDRQLKHRFHCLHSELCVEPSRACKIIVACVVLFNMSKAYFTFEEEDEAEGHEAEEAHEAILQQDFQLDLLSEMQLWMRSLISQVVVIKIKCNVSLYTV